MKIGCCLNMVADDQTGIGIDKIHLLSKLGYDYVELPSAQMMDLTDNEFDQLVATINSSGIKCETSNNLFPTHFKLTGPEVDLEAIVDYADKLFSRLEKLGVQYVVFGSGPAKSIPDGFDFDTGYQQLVELTKTLAKIAEEHGVVIVIEPLRKEESNIINTFAEGVELAKDVDHDCVKVLVDYYHLVEENEPLKNLEDYGKEYLRHVHFAQQDGRKYPVNLEKDESRYKDFMNTLSKIGYNERISIEAYTDNFKEDSTSAIKTLRSLIVN